MESNELESCEQTLQQERERAAQAEAQLEQEHQLREEAEAELAEIKELLEQLRKLDPEQLKSLGIDPELLG